MIVIGSGPAGQKAAIAAAKLGRRAAIVERWDNEASLKSHFATPHMAAFQTAITGAVRSIDARLYDVTNERPLTV